MKQTLVAILFSFAASLSVAAQDPPFRARVRSQFDLPGVTFADIWGQGSFAWIPRAAQRVYPFQGADRKSLGLGAWRDADGDGYWDAPATEPDQGEREWSADPDGDGGIERVRRR